MTEDQPEGLLKPGQIAYRLDLTAAQMKIVHTAVRSLRDGMGREERDVRTVCNQVLDKLPSDADIRAIDLDRELRG